MPTQEVIVKKVEAVRVASIRRTIPTYAAQGAMWNELDAYLARNAIRPIGPCIALYHDTEYRERDVDIETCEPVPPHANGQAEVSVKTLPAVETMATVLHHGGFENIGQAYGALIAWIESSGYRITGTNREVYLRAVVDADMLAQYPPEFVTADEAERLTEIQFPVEKI